MKRKGLLKLIVGSSLVAVLAISIPLMSGCTGAQEPEVKEYNIAFVGPMSGPAAGWGLPGITGLQIMVDEINAEGGLKVGDDIYMLDLFTFDTEAMGSLALQGARQMVLEKDVKCINILGGAETDAIAPFCEENNVVYMPLMQDTMPSRPLCVVGEANSKGDPLRARYLKETYPEIETVAIVSQDDPVGRITNAFEIGAWEAMGVEVVYESYISTETVDFAPIVSAMMAEDPDVLSWGCSWPDFDCFLDEQAFLQGWEGPICSNFVVTDCVASKVDWDWMEASILLDGYPDIDDPWFGEGSKQHAFAEEWQARYGPGAPEDAGYPMDAIAWDYMVTCEPYIRAMAGAGTTDPHAVLAWMKDPANWPLETILGDAVMSGESQFGINNQITPPIFETAEIEVDGAMKKRIIVQYDDYLEWFEENKSFIMGAAEERGTAWHQR